MLLGVPSDLAQLPSPWSLCILITRGNSMAETPKTKSVNAADKLTAQFQSERFGPFEPQVCILTWRFIAALTAHNTAEVHCAQRVTEDDDVPIDPSEPTFGSRVTARDLPKTK